MHWIYRQIENEPNPEPSKFIGFARISGETNIFNTVQQGCRYCGNKLTLLCGDEYGYTREELLDSRMHNGIKKGLFFCIRCGWWCILQEKYTFDGEWNIEAFRVRGVLLNFDPADISIPLDKLRQYLIARYSDRYLINPRKFEEIVGGVFADFEYKVRVTSYSGDKGIDVVALDGENSLIGIQVKRYRGDISAEQIRSFAGALLLNNITKGVFITTSDYKPSAKSHIDEYKNVGMAIELWDAKKFYDALCISQSQFLPDIHDPQTPFYRYWEEKLPLHYVGLWHERPDWKSHW